MNIAMLAEMAAQGLGDRVAIGSGPAGVTYQALYDSSGAVAEWLTGEGIERAVLIDTNSVAAPALLLGCARSGVAYVPLNYRLADAELSAIVARNAPCVVVMDDSALDRLPPTDGVAVVARSQLLAIAAAPAGTSSAREAAPDDVAALIFTSGTSGRPKAAVLRHRHLSSYVLSTVEFMGADPDEVALVSLPPYHVAGVCAVLSGIYVGRRMVYLESFDPQSWVRLVRQERVTHAMVVPTMFDRILDTIEADREGLPHLRQLSYGGGRMPLPTIERAMAVLPQVDFVNAYGLTETSSTIAVLTPEDHRVAFSSLDPLVRKRLRSVGRPIATLEVEIRTESGQPLPPGERGEVYVRGEQVAGEYLESAGPAEGDWFATRDGGYLDVDGYLYLEGRLDDVIVRGGENISPGEIEDVLLTHPAVADVAVVGLPDAEWGELVAAIVVLHPHADRPDARELQDWTRSVLRSSRMPSRIEFAESLPYGDTGKVLRRLLREEYSAPAADGQSIVVGRQS